jgi:hypothetical protein
MLTRTDKASSTKSAKIENFSVTRTLKVKLFHETPGAHIKFNVSNDYFLGRDNDLFATHHIIDDGIHAMVMYEYIPIYDELKK